MLSAEYYRIECISDNKCHRNIKFAPNDILTGVSKFNPNNVESACKTHVCAFRNNFSITLNMSASVHPDYDGETYNNLETIIASIYYPGYI